MKGTTSRRAHAARLLALAAALPACAAAWQIEAGAGEESLSGGRGHWRQVDLALRGDLGETKTEVSARRTERFGLADREFGLRLDRRLDADWSGALAATLSDSHRVLPERSLRLEAQRALGGGWLLDLSARHARYAQANTGVVGLGAQRYFGDAAIGEWHAAAELSAARAAGGDPGAAARLQLDRYLGERNRIGLIVAAGREPDTDALGRPQLARVQTLALLGQWALAPRLALVGELTHTRVHGAYRRSGGRIGVRLDL